MYNTRAEPLFCSLNPVVFFVAIAVVSKCKTAFKLHDIPLPKKGYIEEDDFRGMSARVLTLSEVLVKLNSTVVPAEIEKQWQLIIIKGDRLPATIFVFIE